MKFFFFQANDRLSPFRAQSMIFSLVILIALAACSGQPPYVKPGASEKELEEAISFCQAQQTPSQLNREITDSMSNPGMRGGGMTAGSMAERQRLLDECLRSEGWTPR